MYNDEKMVEVIRGMLQQLRRVCVLLNLPAHAKMVVKLLDELDELEEIAHVSTQVQQTRISPQARDDVAAGSDVRSSGGPAGGRADAQRPRGRGE